MSTLWDFILIGVIGLLIATPAGATGGGTQGPPGPPGATGPAGPPGPAGASGEANVNTETTNYALGAPSVGNGMNNCEMVIPVLGGSAPWEREACAVVRDARAVHELTGDKDAVKALLCTTPRIFAAFALTGRPCPKPQ